MTRILPTAVWVDVLVLLDTCDLIKVLNCGVLGKEPENDSFWKSLCAKRLALHGPEPTEIRDAFGGHVNIDPEVAIERVTCTAEPHKYKDWYFDAISLKRGGGPVVFTSVLRGVYEIRIKPDGWRYPTRLTMIQNGIHRRLAFLTHRNPTQLYICPDLLHMVHTGPVVFLPRDPPTAVEIELVPRPEENPTSTLELKSGRIDCEDGKVLVAACSCWGSWIDTRHIWCPLFDSSSPFKQVMWLIDCWWTDIYCIFKGMKSGVRYGVQWKVRCPKNGLHCVVKIFNHDPSRPEPIMMPVGHKPDLNVENEWDAWRDWYAAGKTAKTEGFLKLRREHKGPEAFEDPIQIIELLDWDKEGNLGTIDVPPTNDGKVDIQLAFFATPGILSSNCVVDYFSLKPLE